MGLLTGLLTIPLAPVRGVTWVADRLLTEAERQLNDDASLRQQLHELGEAYDRGELEDADYDQMEEDLLRRMRQVRRQLTDEGAP